MKDNDQIRKEYYEHHYMTAADWIEHLSHLEPDCKVQLQILVEDRQVFTTPWKPQLV